MLAIAGLHDRQRSTARPRRARCKTCSPSSRATSARDGDAPGARLRAGRGARLAGAGTRLRASRPGPDAARVPQPDELRSGGAAPLVRPRGDRPRGRRAALVLRAEHAHSGRAALRSIDDMDDPFGEAPLPSFPLDAPPPESRERGCVRPRPAPLGPRPTRIRPTRTSRRWRRGRRSRCRRRSSSRPSRRPSSSPRAASTTTPARSSTSSSHDFPTTCSCSSGWPSSTRRSEARGRLGDPPRGGGRRRERTGAGQSEDRSFDIAESLGALDGDRSERRRARRASAARRPGRRRGGLREVQGGRRQADRRRRRADPLRPGRRLQGDGPPRRRHPRVRRRRPRPEARVRLPLDDRHDPARARQHQRGHRRLHARPAVAPSAPRSRRPRSATRSAPPTRPRR